MVFENDKSAAILTLSKMDFLTPTAKRSICEELQKQCVFNFFVVICVFQWCSTAEASKSSVAISAGISRN